MTAMPMPQEPPELAGLMDVDLAQLEAEAITSDPPSANTWRDTRPEERLTILDDARATRRNIAAQEREAERPMTPAEAESFYEYLETTGRDAADEPPPWRTLADVSDEAPGPLLFGMLEDGPTLAYAPPGTGKGTTGAYLITEAQRAGLLPLVYDAERRPREWARRVSGLGGDRSRVVYLEPPDLGPKLAGRPLWEVASAIGEVAKLAGADLLIVDSIMPAVGLGEDRLKSDPSVPFCYVSALEGLGLPSLSFGHPPKGQPEGDPFGSFAWLAAMRLTWLGSTAEGEGHRIRWRPRKRNERGHIPGVLLTVTYGEDGRPSGIERADDDLHGRDWILAALAHGPRSVADMAEEAAETIDNPAAGELDRQKERLGKALRRMAREGWVERLGGAGRGATWQLRTRP